MKKTDLAHAFNDIDEKYIESASPRKNRKIVMHTWKQYIPMVVCAVILVAVIVPSKTNRIYLPKIDEDSNTTTTEFVQSGSPFEECENMKQAEAITGFSINVPEKADNYDMKVITVINREMIEVTYGEDLNIRKAEGTEDISGDYSVYENTEIKKVNDKNITFSGNNGKIMKAVWTDNGYTYSITISDGIEIEKILNIAEQIY